MSILLLNSGSSSLKATLMQSADAPAIAKGLVDWTGTATRYEFSSGTHQITEGDIPCRNHGDAVRRFLADLRAIGIGGSDSTIPMQGVGHRIVHGGAFTSSVRITEEVRSRIAELSVIAPLHNPPSLEALRAAESELPDIPHVAVFDTSFHATLPRYAYTYPVPNHWTRELGVRRYGFHGLSFAYCSHRAAELLGRPLEQLRLVICHLGNGCSAAAIQNGRSVATTMGMTPLEGLMMGTRCGTIDPSIILEMQLRHGMLAGEIETALNRQSGVLGVSQISGDLRQVQAAADQGNEQAQLAIEIYTYRIRQAIGSLAVTMGGVDALVFTAGVGEHAAGIRASACQGLECLGLMLAPDRNASSTPDAEISSSTSPGRILIIHTREDLTMFREVLSVLEAE
ncbi:acetate/propionate family kinase [Planctomicrobium sp. SH661]|uniref:acetate/propionate family kinase n=1 Tax=Planctomicrobium sp. SH661 TaxID=3448124 RepID=UPI003F5AE61E